MSEELIIITKESDVPKTRTRKAFLREYLATCPPTYFPDGSVQCTEKRKRSVSDLLAMTQNRFKKTSLNAVIRILGELNNDGLCHVIWCTGVKKPVVRSRYGEAKEGIEFVSPYSKSNYYEAEGVDGLSLKMIEDIKIQELNGK